MHFYIILILFSKLYKHQQLTPTVLLTKIGKPPNISQSDRVSNNRKEKLHFPWPCGPIRIRFHVRTTPGHYRSTRSLKDDSYPRSSTVGAISRVQRRQFVPVTGYFPRFACHTLITKLFLIYPLQFIILFINRKSLISLASFQSQIFNITQLFKPSFP